MFVFMGNRVGSPPADSDEEEQRDNEAEDDGTVQERIGSSGSRPGAAPTTPPGGEVAPDDDGEEDKASPEPDEDEDEHDEAEPPGDPSEPDTPTGDDGQPEPGDGGDHDLDRDSDSGDDLDDGDEESRFVYGDIVYDRDSVDETEVDKDDLFVVVNLPEMTIGEWECGDGGTVADRFPDYPPRDDVVVVVEREVLDEAVPSWDEREKEIPLSALAEDGVPYGTYPSLRLKLFEASHLRDSDFL